MTEKQEQIIETALTLFAKQGFASTSTNKIAKAAGVSEGLIFRHFNNKEGLLSAILELGRDRASTIFNTILAEQDPKKVIENVLSIPFGINEDQYYFWKLIYSVKWQSETYDDSLSAPLKEALIIAFTKLGASDPVSEAEIVLMHVDGIATSILLRKPKNIEAIKSALLTKYI